MTGTTFISFTSCRLEGGWERKTDNVDHDLHVFTAIKSDAKIHVRNRVGTKKDYFMKIGATVNIKNNIVEFTREDFQNPEY